MDILKLSSKLFLVLLLFNLGCNNYIMKDSNIKLIPSPSQSMTPAKTSEPVPSPTNSVEPVKTPEPIKPSGTIGEAPNVVRLNVLGFVYDKDKNPIPDVKVTIKLLDGSFSKTSDQQNTDVSGKYFFRQLPETRVEISASKEGYKTSLREEIISQIKNNILSSEIKINFGGEGDDAKYALEKLN